MPNLLKNSIQNKLDPVTI